MVPFFSLCLLERTVDALSRNLSAIQICSHSSVLGLFYPAVFISCLEEKSESQQ